MPAITDQCLDPAMTRADLAAGNPAPCERCLAYRPETKSGCLFIERGSRTTAAGVHYWPPIEAKTELPGQERLW